ncbi:MAG TPA: hypothetical protein VFN67_30040 [Polyangiales bacterium]|nr:hypothetical protein [Polyangiales bacterium]
MVGRIKLPIAIVVLLVVVAWQRTDWARVAQWREDQACNLWIGYVQPVLDLPVGLISSVRTPNPNGMPLLAEALSLLPNLWAISSVVGFVQGALLIWVCALLMQPTSRFLLLAVPLLSSVLLSATSVEFWNNWILGSLNLAFFGCYMTYLRSRSLWPIVGCVFLMLYAPAVYLAGLVNALLYFAFTVFALLRYPPERQRWVGLRGNVPPALAAVLVVLLMLYVTWLPYAEVLRDRSVPTPSLTQDSLDARLVHAFEAALDFPRWSLLHWYRKGRDSFLQSSGDIIGHDGELLLAWSELLLLLQTALTLSALGVALARRVMLARTALAQGLFVPGKVWHGRMLLSGVGFVWLAVSLSPVVGGPHWTRSERVDQQVQFLPFLLIASFALPHVLTLPVWLRANVRRMSVLITVLFSAVNVVAGPKIVRAHLRYEGDELTAADIPLAQQRAVARFVAQDWTSFSTSKRVPIFYKHGQEWVIDFGRKLLPFYNAPMVVGRAIDFELSRVYGLENAQEGIQKRSARGARYIVTYRAHAAPEGRAAHHYTIGRMRVTVMQN